MRFAYADPPYPGIAHRYPEREEVDHAALIARLVDEYPDGWALSTGTAMLPGVLALCPPGVRIGAWVKPFSAWKPGVRVTYAWEPLLFRGGRRRTTRYALTRDWVAANMTRQRGVVGAKPVAFCRWVFTLLGAEPGDTLDDLYPGSGAVGRAWEAYLRELPLRPAPVPRWRRTREGRGLPPTGLWPPEGGPAGEAPEAAG
jgi:hypothetical protein